MNRCRRLLRDGDRWAFCAKTHEEGVGRWGENHKRARPWGECQTAEWFRTKTDAWGQAQLPPGAFGADV